MITLHTTTIKAPVGTQPLGVESVPGKGTGSDIGGIILKSSSELFTIQVPLNVGEAKKTVLEIRYPSGEKISETSYRADGTEISRTVIGGYEKFPGGKIFPKKISTNRLAGGNGGLLETTIEYSNTKVDSGIDDADFK